MTKQRIITIIMTILLCSATVLLEVLWRKGIISNNPIFIQWMFTSTAVLVFFGCMLQTFGHPKIAVAISDVVFVILCICMYYSKNIADILTFIGCMFIVLKRASRACACVKDSRCPVDD